MRADEFRGGKSPSYFIRPAVLADVYALARTLREQDRIEVTDLGLTPAIALRACYRNAIIRRTAIVDGEIAAMWGMGGVMLSDIGHPWMLTAPPVEKVPIGFFKEAQRGCVEMLRLKRRLEGHVAANYTQACRFLDALGFALGTAEPHGPHGALFRTFTMVRD